MAYPSVTYTFTNGVGNKADASQVNQNFTDIINGVSDGTKAINISQAGIATLLVSGHTRVRAYKSAAQAIVSGADTKIEFDAETYDTQNEFDIANYKWVAAKSAGYYIVNAYVTFDSVEFTAGDYIILKLYRSGVEFSQIARLKIGATQTDYFAISGTAYLTVGATAYLELYAFVNRTGGNTSVLTGTTYTYLDIIRIA